MNTLLSTVSLREVGKVLWKCYLAEFDFYCNDLIIHFPLWIKALQILLMLLGAIMLFVMVKRNRNKKGFIAIGVAFALSIVVNANNALMKDYTYALVNCTYILNYSARIFYSIDGNIIETNIDMADEAGAVQYAMYLYYNGKQIDTKWYTAEDNYSFEAVKAGEYKVLYFISMGEGETLQVFSEPIIVE